MMNYTTMRKIEIDAAHRVPEHGSGCRRVHGHRYVIEAYCSGSLATDGEQNGMTLDFKFLKESMMNHIHDPCDHGLILRFDDPVLERLAPDWAPILRGTIRGGASHARADGREYPDLKLYIIPYVPTAENLARHWFERLAPAVQDKSEERAKLTKVRVHETPNCWAEYPSDG